MNDLCQNEQTRAAFRGYIGGNHSSEIQELGTVKFVVNKSKKCLTKRWLNAIICKLSARVAPTKAQRKKFART